jgi:glucose/arabinose dehydrogenase
VESLARTGNKVIRIPTKNGKASSEYIDFMTGFVTPEGNVWGRRVGVAMAKDGALLVTDDGGNCIWRVSYESSKPSAESKRP